MDIRTSNDTNDIHDARVRTGQVVVDLFDNRCPHCPPMHPIMDRLASEFAGTEVAFARIDVSKTDVIDVDAVPTFMFFRVIYIIL